MTDEVLWGKRTWCEVRDSISKLDAVILPVGSCEQHGPHMPLDTDAFIAYELSKLIAIRLMELGHLVYVLPPINYGLSEMWSMNEGTVTVDADVFMNYVKSVLKSVIKQGVGIVIILNGHAGNFDALKLVAREITNELGKGRVYVLNWWDLVGDYISKISSTPFFHADEVETSVAMYLGQRVIVSKARSESIKRKYSEEWHSLDLTKRPKVYRYECELRKYEVGAFGHPERASVEKGEVLVKEFIRRFVKLFKDIIEGKF